MLRHTYNNCHLEVESGQVKEELTLDLLDNSIPLGALQGISSGWQKVAGLQ